MSSNFNFVQNFDPATSSRSWGGVDALFVHVLDLVHVLELVHVLDLVLVDQVDHVNHLKKKNNIRLTRGRVKINKQRIEILLETIPNYFNHLNIFKMNMKTIS